MYDNHKVNPLHIMLPKTSTYVKSYDRQTKWMYFLIEADELLENVSGDIKKEFDNEPVYNKEYLKKKNLIAILKLKIKGKNKSRLSKVDSNHTCLAVISLDFVLKKDENYYPQVFFKRG